MCLLPRVWILHAVHQITLRRVPCKLCIVMGIHGVFLTDIFWRDILQVAVAFYLQIFLSVRKAQWND